MAYYDCPQKLLRQSPDVLDAVNYYTSVFKPHSHLPQSGGWLDQPATFCETMQRMTSLEAEITEEKHERRKRDLRGR
jgi:hypothetical protein